jgi:hypothetical protein
MAIPPRNSDDELSYEDFDDATWVDDELEAIDLDALDADILDEEDDTAPSPPAPDQAAASLLDAIDTLGDDLPPAEDVEATPPVPAESLGVEESTPSDTVPSAALPAPTETPSQPVADAESAAELVTEAVTEPAPDAESDAVPDAESVVEPLTEAEALIEPDVPLEPVIPPEIYCALLPLPEALALQVIELRKTGEIATMPPPGIVLTAPFRTADRPAVEATLAEWARAHLPFQFETVGIVAKVIGAQQYVAAWTLEPEEEIVEAQHALKRVLADLILPLPGATMTFSAYVPIGEQIVAPRYPHVVGQMQRDFEPFVWHANDLQLVCRRGQPGQWDIIKSFD